MGSPPKVEILIFTTPFQVFQDGLERHSGMWSLLPKLDETSTSFNLLLHWMASIVLVLLSVFVLFFL